MHSSRLIASLIARYHDDDYEGATVFLVVPCTPVEIGRRFRCAYFLPSSCPSCGDSRRKYLSWGYWIFFRLNSTHYVRIYLFRVCRLGTRERFFLDAVGYFRLQMKEIRPWSRVCLQKLIAAWLVKFSDSWSRNFIRMFTKARHCTLSRANYFYLASVFSLLS
jgi:hypothetical protein